MGAIGEQCCKQEALVTVVGAERDSGTGEGGGGVSVGVSVCLWVSVGG